MRSDPAHVGSTVLVWDAPTRLFHWMLVFLVALAWITGEAEGSLFLVHQLAGYGVAVLLLFRVIWGFTGSRHSRFSDFVRPWHEVLAQAKDVLRLRPARTLGHNPLGGWMALLLLLVLAAQVGTGLFASEEGLGGPLAGAVSSGTAHAITELHEGLSGALLAGSVLREQADLMDRQIEWHLARARAAGAHAVLGARAPVAGVARDLEFSLERLYRGRALEMEVQDLDGLVFQGDPQDLEEMLGNLMDNACKWARRRVRVSGSRSADRLRLAVEDDGPGIAEEDRAAVLLRGRRLDEATPGAGLGLAIVGDLAELYRGSLELTRSDLGGLRATLDLPAAD